MNQEIIRDFWNLPRVLGVALLHGQAGQYFYFKEQILDWEKQALIQMILDTIRKNTQKFDFLKFQIMGYHAYTYKLNPIFILVFLTPTDIIANKLLVANELKAALQEDIGRTITTFELLTKKIPQSKAASNANNADSYDPGKSDNAPLKVTVTIEELLNALNHLSQFSSNYMGKKLTANYWQLSRPNFDWLDNFRINHSAKITFSGALTEPVSALQYLRVKEWTTAFIKQCSQIIRDFPTIIEQKGLDEREKRLLLTSPAGDKEIGLTPHLPVNNSTK